MSSTTQIGNLARTFTATVTLEQYAVTKLLANGTVSVATKDPDDIVIGTNQAYAPAQGLASIQLANGGGTRFVTAASTVTIGNELYRASGGKVEAAITGVVTVTGDSLGISLSNGVSGDVVEMLLA